MSQKTVASLMFSGVLWACSGGASDPLVESCAGRYTCSTASTTVETTLVKQTNGCFAGEIRLGSDHIATLPSGRQGSWAGSVERFDVCEGSDCIVCRSTMPAPAVDAAVHVARCAAFDAGVRGCSDFNNDPDQCTAHGCATKLGGDGGNHPYCSGTVTSCWSIFDEAECTGRSDCAWE